MDMHAGAAARAETTRSAKPRAHWRLAALLRRALLAVLVLAQTLVASYFMVSVLPYHGGNGVEQGLVGLFAILFAWISVGFWIALFGFFLRRRGGDANSLARRHSAAQLAQTPLARTAVLIPVCHEPVGRTFRGVRAIFGSLKAAGHLEHFDFHILSDSRDPNVWLAEQQAWFRLCEELDAANHLFYRHRTVNLRYKSGNIADFLRRWGQSYKYMIVLDADSVMSGETLARMVRHMELEPQIGILQTNPALFNAKSAFARFQQFANRFYGPLFSAGLASVQLGEAVYWGHNAILRIDPFVRHCGLRELPGIGLFKGPIMSHDFVEAAYMGRAGYEIWLEPDLPHSYEESPPTLVDELTRDRRWAKGNLQHLWLMLFGRRIRLAHRLAFLNGIMSYLASPLWLAFLILTSIETTRFVLWPIDYFPSPHSLFPLWPEWHPEWAIGLLGGTALLLFIPKFLAIVDVMLSYPRRDYGGGTRLTAGVLLEILVSMLLAPIRMLTHSRYVVESMINVSLAWAGQNRTDETRWAEAILHQAPGTLIAMAWAGFALWLKPMFFIWSLPVSLPLIFAAPTSVFLSRVSIGQRLRRRGLLVVPEELNDLSLLDAAVDERILPPCRTGLSVFEEAVIDPLLNRVHCALGRARRNDRRRGRLCALRVRCMKEGPYSLSQRELSLLASDSEALEAMNRAAWSAPPDSYWGSRLEERIIRDRGQFSPAKP
jgi:membrane glycosyltransferase